MKPMQSEAHNETFAKVFFSHPELVSGSPNMLILLPACGRKGCPEDSEPSSE